MSVISRKSRRLPSVITRTCDFFINCIFLYTALKLLFPFKGVALHHICLTAGPGLSLTVAKKRVCCQLEKFPP